jgi:leucyl-tRNA synthetase
VDRSLIVATHVTLPVQINGRKRADLTVPRDADSKAVEAAALALDAVQRALDNRPAKKVVVVPNRIVNVVV